MNEKLPLKNREPSSLPSPALLQKMLANFGKVIVDLDKRVRVLEKKTENLP